MPSARAETFILRRSDWLRTITLLGHIAAWIGLVTWPAPLPIRLVLAVAVGVSLAVALRQPWPVSLSRHADGWSLTDCRGRVRHGGVVAGGRMLPGVTVVTFSGGFANSVVLPADAFVAGDSATLRALLRHQSAGPA